ncbi:FAD-binding oxidoreductase [Kitasatospora indigofera]|uniref:FAD-binding oxidoreductase n=1 Tax=Kitasatospora indigofera TaxID=67307 RepID=UPI0036B5876E
MGITDADLPGSAAALDELRSGFEGPLLLPADEGYDEVRAIWNGMHDRRPALIARCRSTADIAAAVRFARAAGLPATVRGGGHNVAGTAVDDDAVMIDLSLLRTVTVDPQARLARAEGGSLLKDVDTATAAHGLACPAGVVGHTGLGGLALGGGYGWLTRKWGLTCDHIVQAELVLADGSVVQATDESHPDLMRALRGGIGNFAVVAAFTLELRPVGPLSYRSALYLMEDAPAVLRAFRSFTEKQSDDLRVFGAFQELGHDESVPAALRGRQALDLAVVCSADDPESLAQSAQLLDAVPAAGYFEQTMSYYELQARLDASGPAGRRYFTKTCYLADLADGTIEQLVEAARRNPSRLSSIDVEFLRGAITEGTGRPSAFPHRDAAYLCTAWAAWLDPEQDEANVAWSRGTMAALSPWQTAGSYGNYVPEDESAAPAGDAWLAEVKERYDPENLFRGRRNVVPAV